MAAHGLYFNAEESHGRSDHRIIIIVEGSDDAYFMDKILSDLSADTDQVRIAVAKGVGNIPYLIKALTLSAPFKVGKISKIIVVSDADDSEEDSILPIHTALGAVGLPTPKAGTFESDGAREVGLLIIPGNNRLGELADLLLAATNDARLEAVSECFDGIVQAHGPLPKPSRSKRVAHMYMQVRAEDCRGVGRAYALGAFTDDARIGEIRDFIRHAL